MAYKLLSALGQSSAHLPPKLLGSDNQATLQNEWCARLCLMKCRDSAGNALTTIEHRRPSIICTVYHTVYVLYVVNVSDRATCMLVDTFSLDYHCCTLYKMGNCLMAGLDVI